MLTGLLIVTAVALGGPQGSSPQRLENAVVHVQRDGRQVAASRHGEVRKRLRRGAYRVSAELLAPHARHAQRCASRTAHVGRGVTRVTLYCRVQ